MVNAENNHHPLERPSPPAPMVDNPFAIIVENMAEAFFAFDQTGHCTYRNQKSEQLFTTHHPNLLYETLWNIFQVDATSELYQQYHRAVVEQRPIEFEEFYPLLNRWFAVRFLPSIGGLSAYFQDITERKETEAALRQEQEFLKVLLDNVQAGIVACDAEGCLRLFNQAARSFHGMEEQPLPPEQWADQYDLYLPDGKTLMTMEDIPLYRALQGQIVQNVEMKIVPKQGIARFLLAHGQMIRSPDGETQGAVVVMHDITQRQQIEAALRESEAQLSSIFQTIPDGIALLNHKGQIITANSAAEQILRLTHGNITEHVYNDPFWSITTVDGKPFPDEDLPFAQVMRTGKPVYGIEHAIAHSDGTRIILSINASPLFDTDGNIVHVIAAITDVTERKQAEVSLRESEERYRSVIETAAEGIVLQQADGRIFTCNASAERILGLTAEQMMGSSSLDPQWQTIYEDGSPFPGELHPAMVTLRTGKPQSNVTMGIRKPEGSLTWISINTRPLVQADDSMPFAVVVSFFDITERKQAEAELLISDVALQQMPDAILLTDLNGTIQRWLGSAEQIFGYTVAEAMGQPVSFLHHPNIQPMMTAQILHSIQETGTYWGEISCVRKDGSVVPIETTAKTVYDKTGHPIFFIGINKDITERKQAEAERTQLLRQQVQEQTARLDAEANLRRSSFLVEVSTALATSLDYEQTLQSVAKLAVPYFADWCCVDLLNDDGSISRVAVAHSDPEKVQFAWDLTERFPRHLEDGYGISQVMKTGHSEIAIAITDEQLTAAIANSEYLNLLRGVGLKSYIVAPLQTRERVLGSISFVFTESNRHYDRNDLGLAEELARQAGIAIDNARLYHMAQTAKQTAETAAARTAQLQMVTAALSEPLTPIQVAEVIVEQSLAAVEADAALMALLSADGTALEIVRAVGYEANSAAMHQQIPLKASVPLAEAMRTGQPIWSEPLTERLARYPHLADNYKKFPFQAWISLPLIVEGKAVGGLSLSFKQFKQLSQDDREFMLTLSRQCAQAISRAQLYEAERMARTEAERANRVKDEFLAILSHELRSPLNPILGWARLLQSGTLDQARVKQALTTIERNAKLQSELIEDLLDISRILRGKLSLTVSPVSLASTISSAVETVRLAAEAKAIRIETQIHPDVGFVSGDLTRLQQTVWNLLSNAVKFTPPGGRVDVQLEAVGDHAQIRISDTGKGISPEFLPHVFDYFQQEDGATTRKFGGLGLGLAIVRHLVELHGGTIQAHSTGEGLGATFTVTLPLMATPPRTNPEAALPESSPDLQGIQVLVVDDDDDTRDFIAFLLEQAGARVITSISAHEGLLALTKFQPDVLLSDIGMPDMDGYMLIQQIRALPADRGGQIHAIALTAYAGDWNQQQALQAGFQRHLAKPIEPDELIRAIRCVNPKISPGS